MSWQPIKSERQINALPIGSKIRVANSVRLAAGMYKQGGILTRNGIPTEHEKPYGIHTPTACCFLFEATEYEFLTI